jgi:hypothetical protein
MMIGVAQVIGTKPTASFVFSSCPADSAASARAAWSGKMSLMAASAVEAPTARRKRRRLTSEPNIPVINAASTERASAVSVASGCAAPAASCSLWLRWRPHEQPASFVRGSKASLIAMVTPFLSS